MGGIAMKSPVAGGSLRVRLLIVLGLGLLAAGCGAAPAAPAAGDTGDTGLTVSAEGVVLAPEVVQLDAAATKANLKGADTDGTLVFDASTPGLGGIKAGAVLVMDGVGARKVISSTTSGSTVSIATEDATAGDVVKDGKISWTYRIAYDSLPEKTYEVAMAQIGLDRVPALAANGPLDASQLKHLAVSREALRFVGKVSGFEVEFKLTPTAEQLKFELSATRANVKVQAAGFISQFDQETQIEFDEGTATLFDTEVSKLRGEAEVTWNAFQVNDPSLDSDITALQLPLSLPIPFMAGPLPMTLNIKANIRVVPELTSGNASSGGAWKVTYDTDHGFSSNGGDATPRSQLRNALGQLGSAETVTAGLGVVGFAVGFEVPRLELQLGHPFDKALLGQVGGGESLYEKANALLRPYAFLTLNTYVNGQWTPGTTLTSDIPPCQRSSVKVSAIAGYKLSVLGMAELSDNKLLWEKDFDRFKDDKPCTLTGQ
jgi:hypothetical protein